ncbi:hypothetical protein FrCorBMG51_15275 [Protofrankia coriariae]|uniref:Uncharacterized protein n=1 Tax=Protofrankia coriariae TaxID=1562887 RepID=A0ABR5F263_9ACTN|nr:hypothetical protein FrCorBMG51_15275 [Protofrankia coriariae]
MGRASDGAGVWSSAPVGRLVAAVDRSAMCGPSVHVQEVVVGGALVGGPTRASPRQTLTGRFSSGYASTTGGSSSACG